MIIIAVNKKERERVLMKGDIPLGQQQANNFRIHNQCKMKIILACKCHNSMDNFDEIL